MTAFSALIIDLSDGGVRSAVLAAWGAVAMGGVAYAVMDCFVGARRAKRLGATRAAGAGRRGQPKKSAVFSFFEPEENSAEARRRSLERSANRTPGLRARLTQAGLDVSPVVFIGGFAALSIVLGVLAAHYGAPPIVAALGATVFAFVGPNQVIKHLIAKRQEKFLEAFPHAIDILVRGVKAGLPVNEGMKVIADEVSGPCGEEIERMIAATNVGFSLEDAAGQLAQRVPSPDVNFFRTVIIIQKQTGGNLAEALATLADTIRERQKLRKKVWALSSEARMSAIIIGSLPLVVAGMVYLMRPDYLNVMFVETIGQIALAGAAGWMLIGVLVMRSMINFKA